MIEAHGFELFLLVFFAFYFYTPYLVVIHPTLLLNTGEQGFSTVLCRSHRAPQFQFLLYL